MKKNVFKDIILNLGSASDHFIYSAQLTQYKSYITS